MRDKFLLIGAAIARYRCASISETLWLCFALCRVIPRSCGLLVNRLRSEDEDIPKDLKRQICPSGSDSIAGSGERSNAPLFYFLWGCRDLREWVRLLLSPNISYRRPALRSTSSCGFVATILLSLLRRSLYLCRQWTMIAWRFVVLLALAVGLVSKGVIRVRLEVHRSFAPRQLSR